MPYVSSRPKNNNNNNASLSQSTTSMVVSTGRGFDRLNNLVSFMSSLDIQNNENNKLKRHVSQKPLINPPKTSIEQKTYATDQKHQSIDKAVSVTETKTK